MYRVPTGAIAAGPKPEFVELPSPRTIKQPVHGLASFTYVGAVGALTAVDALA